MNEKVMAIFGIGGLAGLLMVFALAAPGEAATNVETTSGAYLAGRHAQETRDYAAAASWYEDALKTDPESPELISRTFLMEASEGRFDRARLLAKRELKLDPTDAVAELILLIDRVKAGDKAGALALAEALAGGRRASLPRPAGARLDPDRHGRPRWQRCRATPARQIQRLRPARILSARSYL